MEQSLLEQPVEESATILDEVLDVLDTGSIAVVGRTPSYRPTPWKLANQSLDLIDRYTGLAGMVQKFFSFAFIGGCAALVNIAVYALFMAISMPVSFVVHDTIAYLMAFEISVIANFVPNDFFTFRHAPGRERSWLMRGIRFNITSISGGILTYLIHGGLILLHISPFISQAAALLIVLFYNFAFHNLFTYRKVKKLAVSEVEA